MNNYKLNEALLLIDKGIHLSTMKNNLIIEIEINFLKSLILSRKGKIEDAKNLCSRFNSILENKKMYAYQKRQQETLKLITDHENFNLNYGLVEDTKSKKEKELIEQKLEQETFDYLNLIMRYVKEKEISSN